MIEIEAAWPLLLAVIALLAWWVGLHARTNLSRRHRVVVTVLRCAAILALALAAARPQWNGGSAEVSVVYALDVSRSVSPAFVTEALEWIGQAQRERAPAHSRIVAFAERPAVLRTVEEVRSLDVTGGTSSGTALALEATDLERALDESLLALDGEKVRRLVLLSDGNQTLGDVWRALPRLKSAGVRVFTVPARVRDETDAWANSMEVPDPVRDSEPIAIVVRVVSMSETTARVALYQGSRVLGAREARLRAGTNAISFETRLRGSGLAMLSAQVSARGDRIAENDRIERAVWVGGRSRVLYVEGRPESADHLAAALRAEAIDVDLQSPSALPSSAADLTQYDAVVLSDVPARALNEQSMHALESYVRDLGGGFLFIGGENAFGERGYTGSAVEKILPVEFKSREKRRDLALVIAIDRSYSMKGRKIEFAKEAARAALDLLEEQHRFAVVAFDSQPHISVPLQQVRSRKRAEDQISRIQASGQTNIYPALGVVYRTLQQAEAESKHVILLSDGDTHPADFQRLLERMREAKIVVSTVTIGEGGDPLLMENIARWGGGRNYLAISAESIPQIFIEETQKAVGENLTEETVRAKVKWRMAAFAGVDLASAPALKGLVATKPRDTAEIALATERDAALLVRWQYGLGKSVAFTSDAKNRWAVEWLRWPGYGKFWAQLLRDTMRREGGGPAQLHVSRDGADALITLTVLDDSGTYRNGLAPRAQITRPDREPELVTLAQSGPGRYRVRLPTARSDSIAVALVPGGGLSARSALAVGTRVLTPEFSDELRSRSPDVALLETIASLTGGKMAPAIDEVFDAHGDSGRRTHALWPWLMALALVLYVLEIFARRSRVAWRWLGS